MLVTLYFHFTEYSGSHFHAAEVIFPKTHLERLALQHYSNKVLWAGSSLSSWRCMPPNRRLEFHSSGGSPFIQRNCRIERTDFVFSHSLPFLPHFPLSLFFSLPLWSPKCILFSIFSFYLKLPNNIFTFSFHLFTWGYENTHHAEQGQREREMRKRRTTCPVVPGNKWNQSSQFW